jgi:hypothetical protein
MSSNKLSFSLEIKTNQVMQAFDYLNKELNKIRDFLGKPLNIDADASSLKQEVLDAGGAIDGLSGGDVAISGDASGVLEASEDSQEAIDQVPENKETNFTGNNQSLLSQLGQLGLALNTVSMAYNKVQSVLGGYISASHLQEKSEQSLINAMQVKGVATASNINMVMKLAGETQNLTTVGDEESMQLLSMATNMGITTEKMEEALHGSIGLATAFASAGLSRETAMKGIALAYEGEFSQLQRYIPALRSAKDDTEKMALLQEAMANGFKLSQAETETGAGALEQYRNLVGDLREKIGDMINQALTPLIKAFTEVVAFLNEYPGLVNVLIPVLGSLAVAVAFLTTKQIALNAAKAVGAALTGNWILLASAAAVGLGVYALSVATAGDKQEELAEKTKKSNDELEHQKKLIQESSIKDLKTEIANNLAEITKIDQEIEKQLLRIEQIQVSGNSAVNENLKRQAQAELDSLQRKRDNLINYNKEYQANIDEQERLTEEYNNWKIEQDRRNTLAKIDLLKEDLDNARTHYESLDLLTEEDVKTKQKAYEELLQAEQDYQNELKQIKEGSGQDEDVETGDALSVQNLNEEKNAMVQHYANLSVLRAVDVKDMTNRFSEYLEKVKTVYKEESEEYKQIKAELDQITKASNMRLIQEKGSFASQIASLSRTTAEKEIVIYENLMTRLSELYDEDYEKYKDYQQAIKDAYVKRTMETYANENDNFDKQRQAVDDYFATHHDMLIANGVSEEEIHRVKEEAKSKITEQELQHQLSINQQVATGLSGIFANLTKAVTGESEKSFKIRKALSIVQATIDTFAGANAAFKAMATIPIVGPGLATAAATAAIVAGMANVKKISAQKYNPPKAETGGFLTGNSHARGGIIIEAEGGEYITRKSRVAELGAGLFSFINNAPIDAVRRALAGLTFPKVSVPTVPQVAYATGGQITGGLQILELISEVKLLRRDLQEKDMSVNVELSANEVIRQADNVLINESNMKGALERGGIYV